MPESPAGYLEPYVRGSGFVEIVGGTAPGAATAFSLTNQSSKVSLLESLVFTFTADANAANRAVRVEWDDGNGTIFAGAGIGAVITASTTAFFRGSVDRGTADWDTVGFAYFPLPRIFVQPGQKLQINVTNIQAGDTITGIVMLWERFERGPAD